MPLFVRGVGAGLFATYATETDTYRGAYLDNTNIFDVMNSVIMNAPPNTPPAAIVDSAATQKGTLVTINVIANDYDIDGTINPATVTVADVPGNGTAVSRADGTVDYTPVTGFSGQDSFTYTVADACGTSSNVSTVTITVNPGGTPVMTSPVPGSTLTTSTVTFQWSTGTGVSVYWLGAGTSFTSVNTPPYGDIYGASTLKRTTQQVTGIPINGNPVYVRLWWKIGTGAWTYSDYTYQTQEAVIRHLLPITTLQQQQWIPW
ncbi:MAG: cadherin-like domain-containing protein [Candidatus Scalindua sp.]|nr:cadherin-like domain-containing protein [Candidatus Scalindua sp.]